MDAHTRGRIYLEHLTRTDVDLLVRVAADAAGPGHEELRRRPERIETLLAEPAAYEAVFGSDAASDDALVGASPFLVFAVALERARVELVDLPYVQEWTGPRQRLPVFATEELRTFLDDPGHRLFLAELLASYTRVSGGTIALRRHGVVERRRFSELDLTAMAALLDLVTEEARPGLYRRLGDLTLLLTGVFPDHTARHRFAPIEVDRLARALRPAGDAQSDRLFEALAVRGAVGLLEQLGQRWYRLALEGAGHQAGTLAALGSVGERFVDARRALNHLTDQHLFRFRARWFPPID